MRNNQIQSVKFNFNVLNSSFGLLIGPILQIIFIVMNITGRLLKWFRVLLNNNKLTTSLSDHHERTRERRYLNFPYPGCFLSFKSQIETSIIEGSERKKERKEWNLFHSPWNVSDHLEQSLHLSVQRVSTDYPEAKLFHVNLDVTSFVIREISQRQWVLANCGYMANSQRAKLDCAILYGEDCWYNLQDCCDVVSPKKFTPCINETVSLFPFVILVSWGSNTAL